MTTRRAGGPFRLSAPPQDREARPAGPVRFSIPLPYPELSPNYRPKHKHEKHLAITAYREEVEKDARNARIEHRLREPIWAPVGIRIVYIVTRAIRRDADNLLAQLKSAIDGLVQARLLEDDSSAKLLVREIDVVVDRNVRRGRVELELEHYSPADDPASLAYRLVNGGPRDG